MGSHSAPLDSTGRLPAAVMQQFATSVAQLMDMHHGVRLSHTDDHGWCADTVEHEVWFGSVFLTIIASSNAWSMPPEPWSYSDGIVKLVASNGSWLWKLTGERREGVNIDGPLVQLRAVWPD